jgi:hypothetical protein
MGDGHCVHGDPFSSWIFLASCVVGFGWTVTGGSAGDHLAALLALTANDPRLQPGFEAADTRVAAAVPFYGVYDFTDRHALKGSGTGMVEWLEETVMPCPPAADPTLQVRRDAPPFFILRGTHDSLGGPWSPCTRWHASWSGHAQPRIEVAESGPPRH